jgi:hypothetical protein
MTDETANEAVIAMRLRIKAIDAEAAALWRQEQAISQQRSRLLDVRRSLEVAIDHEEALLTPLDPVSIPEMHPTLSGQNLSDLLLEVLKSGPKSLGELKEYGKRWMPLQESNFPGRAINFALVGLQKGGHVDRNKNGQWKLTSEKLTS